MDIRGTVKGETISELKEKRVVTKRRVVLGEPGVWIGWCSVKRDSSEQRVDIERTIS